MAGSFGDFSGDFSYDAMAGRVVFGAGRRREAATEIDALGAKRVVIVAGELEEAMATDIAEILGERVAGRFSDVAQHVPADAARAAVACVDEARADGVVTVGGGSATGFGKAIALERKVSFLAVPTTYAGSEMTAIWGLSEGGRKQTGSDLRVKPQTVIYDPELTLSLPARIAGPSGMNAMAHAVEALYGPGANPVISALAVESIRALRQALPAVCESPDSLEARSQALYGTYLAGVALATGGTALHHKACHVLGGMFNLNHGDMNAVMLGHALAYNAPAIPAELARIADALGVEAAAAPGALFDTAAAIGAPTSLEAIGMPADGIDEAARRVVVEAAANVRPPEPDGIRRMLSDAYHGRRPAPATAL